MTEKFDVLRGRLLGTDFPGVDQILVQRFFHLFFFSSITSEKSFIPYKPSAAVQALKFVQFGQESCPAGEYLQQKNKKIKID